MTRGNRAIPQAIRMTNPANPTIPYRATNSGCVNIETTTGTATVNTIAPNSSGSQPRTSRRAPPLTTRASPMQGTTNPLPETNVASDTGISRHVTGGIQKPSLRTRYQLTT